MFSLIHALAVFQPSESQQIIDLINQASTTYTTLGMLGAMGALVYGLVRVYRLSIVQNVVIKVWPKLAWDVWPRPIKILVVFLTAVVASLLTALATGVAWQVALPSSLGAGFVAIGSDQVVTAAVTRPELTGPKP
jgi:MFS superfamily sulfate permease-like transporter